MKYILYRSLGSIDKDVKSMRSLVWSLETALTM